VQQLLFSLNNLFERLPGALIPFRWLCLLLLIAMSIFAGMGIKQHFEVNMSPEVWLEDDAPPLQIRDAFRHQFGSDEGVYIVYRHASGDVFSESALSTLAALHKDIEQASLSEIDSPISRITQVDSLYNARYQIAEGDTLIAKKLIGADFPDSEAERERRRSIARSQDSFERVYYSSDFT
jgi:predicted RND superfamily exporter protein